MYDTQRSDRRTRPNFAQLLFRGPNLRLNFDNVRNGNIKSDAMPHQSTAKRPIQSTFEQMEKPSADIKCKTAVSTRLSMEPFDFTHAWWHGDGRRKEGRREEKWPKHARLA